MVITDIRQVTPELLTRRLIEKGHAVVVEQVEVTKSRLTEQSAIYHLALRYRQNNANLPSRLLLKLPVPELGWEGHEVDFYRRVVPIMRIKGETKLPFIHCYDATYDASAARSHLLLEDVSDLYFSFSDQTPTRAHYEQVMDGLAKVHAFWWEHPHLGNGIGERLNDEDINRIIERAERRVTEIFKDRGIPDTLLYEIASKWPALRRERIVNGWGITLVHRDTQPQNFLYALHGHSIKIIDWQSWRVDTGTDDLAYLMACHWDWGQRVQVERDLLKHYHERLVEYGVRNYTFDDVLYDYRASIVRCLFFLILAWSPAQWERIGRGVQAFEEWHCGEIL